MLSVDYDDTGERVQMIRCLQCDACRIADLVRVFLFDLVPALSHSMKPREPMLTIDFFVSQVQLGPLDLSPLFDTSSGQLEEPLDTDMKYDTSHKHANYQDDCEAARAGGICNCGYYGHFCFVDNDDYLPCVAVVDA